MSIFNFNGYQSPPRRPLIIPSPTSPFSTSPSQLEEVTLDYDGTFTNSLGGTPSPCGPMRGRSVKEFEDQLAGLKKENFNLKLRIYFLEERMGSNYDLNKENIIKKNIELKVDVESLRKELKEKHDLLCQADKALELQDDEYKKIIDKKDESIREFRKEIDELKTQISVLQKDNSAKVLQESMNIFQEKFNVLKNELLQEQENNSEIRLVLHNKDAKIKNLTAELDGIRQKLQKRDNEFDELTRKFDDLSGKNQLLLKKLQESKELINNIKMENNENNKKQSVLQTDYELLKKRYDTLKTTTDEKIADLQAKLELSSNALKKSQDLVVSSSRQDLNPIVNNDSFLVSKPSTSPRYKTTDPIPITSTKITFLSTSTSSSSSSSISPPSTIKSLLSPTTSTSLLKTSDTIVEQLKKEREHYHQKTIKLKAEQIKACHIIKKMIERQNSADNEINELKKKIRSLEAELESTPTKSDQKQSMDGNTTELDKYKSQIKQLEDNYEALLSTLDEKNSELENYQKQQDELVQTIKDHENQIVDLQFQILTTNEKIPEYERKLDEKNTEIEKLQNEISKKNIDLQGIVNKELWDKNREIEKLQARHASKIIEQKDTKIQNLESELTTKQQQLDLIKTKISELGININNDDNCQLKNHLQDELKQSEQLRHEANEVCTILSRRLEELAVFLDSLLKQKTVLGLLGNKENRKLREIIDQSLDLTRSFSTSMLLNPDQSLTQLTNITNILNDTNNDSVTLTYQSHLYCSNNDNIENKESQCNSQIIDALRQQIVTLKYELRLRDVELNKIVDVDGKKVEKSINTTSTLKYQSDMQSESESWSEPDRSVSRARIGLFNENSKSPRTQSLRKSTNLLTSESEEVCRSNNNSNNNSRTPRKHDNRQTILELNNQLYELEQKLNNKVDEFNELQQLFNAEQEKNRGLMQKFDDLAIKQQQYKEQINQLDIDREKVLNVAREAEELAEVAKSEMRATEIQMQTFKTNTNNYQQQLESEYKKQLQEIEDNAKIQIEELQATLQQVRYDCVENCAKKYELEAALNQLKSTEKLLSESNQQISDLTEKQRINEDLLKESQDKIDALLKDLEDSKLEYSNCVLEKSKLTNEKTCLEQELSNLTTKHSVICRQLEDIEKELEITRENHQRELLAVDEQKSRLELRISELESTNAQLQNRLIKIQTGYNNANESILLSSSLPNYRRQLSDHSGYTSEEQQLIDNQNNGGNNNKSPNRIEIERQEGNSSPDLGIESDHGRFSSLETHLNVPRPLLQTLELTESMNNLLDGDNSNQPTNCGDVRCCERTQRIVHENSDLKRELTKTKRVLEETVNKLALANQRKKQIEKTICRQIHKTSQVLKKAKANLDSGSETDLYKK